MNISLNQMDNQKNMKLSEQSKEEAQEMGEQTYDFENPYDDVTHH